MKRILGSLFAYAILFFSVIPSSWAQDKKYPASNANNKIAYQETLQKAEEHLENAVETYSDPQKQPRTFDKGEINLIGMRDWTSGFFPGSLWYLYGLTDDPVWRERAEKYSEPLKELVNYKVDHDMGFMLYCSLGNAYRFTGDEAYKDILVKGAKVLADRYDPKIKVIKSWDWGGDKWDYPVIIDNMMNLELLMFATKVTGDSLYAKVAIEHADTTLENHFRDDNSSYHLVDYDSATGQVLRQRTYQGYADASAWARGQSWALYGYTMMYRETKDEKYLAHAKDIAKFLLNHPRLPEDKVPYWDFDDPDIPNTERDASAAAIISSALFELYQHTGTTSYMETATEILKSLASPNYLAEPGENHHFLLMHSVGNKPGGGEIDVPLNYADYYFLEALYRYGALKKKSEIATVQDGVGGYRGIWFTLGQPYEYGDKYSGGLSTYTAKHRPMAIYSPVAKKTFFVYGGTTTSTEKHLLCMIGAFDHRTKTISKPVVVHDKNGVDDPHDNPSVLIDGEGYIWMFVSGRGDRRPGFKYKSNEAHTIDKGFTLMSKEEMAYPQPWYVDGKGFIHLFTKYTGLRELYFETSQDGITWSKDQKLAGIKADGEVQGGHYQVSTVHNGKVMTFFNRHIGGSPDKRTDLYYMESGDLGATWQTADGKALAIPLQKINEGQVVDHHKTGKFVYLKDVTVDQAGNPMCLYAVSNSHEPGPDAGPRQWKLTRWTGQRWETHDVTVSDHNYDMGSLYVEDGIWKVIAPFAPGPQPHQTGGEIEIWSSTDEGTTWAMEAKLTEDSTFNHTYVRRPENAQEAFKAFWADGDPTRFSTSRLYYLGEKGAVNQMPYTMDKR